MLGEPRRDLAGRPVLVVEERGESVVVIADAGRSLRRVVDLTPVSGPVIRMRAGRFLTLADSAEEAAFIALEWGDCMADLLGPDGEPAALSPRELQEIGRLVLVLNVMGGMRRTA